MSILRSVSCKSKPQIWMAPVLRKFAQRYRFYRWLLSFQWSGKGLGLNYRVVWSSMMQTELIWKFMDEERKWCCSPIQKLSFITLKADVVLVANCSYNKVHIKMSGKAEESHSGVPRTTHNEQNGSCHSKFWPVKVHWKLLVDFEEFG